MAWLSRNDLTPSDRLYADQLNSLSNDIRTWGGNVNGGGNHLANVILDSSVSFPSAQTPWAGDIDAAGHGLNNAGSIHARLAVTIAGASSTDSYAALAYTSYGGLNRWDLDKTNAAETGGNVGSDLQLVRYSDSGSLLDNVMIFSRAAGNVFVRYNLGIGVNPAYKLDVSGDCNITGTYRVNGVALSAASQTPWSTNIDGAGHDLNNAGSLRATTSLEVKAPAGSTTTRLYFQSSAGVNRFSCSTFSPESGGNTGSNWVLDRWADDGSFIGSVMFCDRAQGNVRFFNNVGVGVAASSYRLDIGGDVNISGILAVGSLPSANPGAGSKRIWYDPSDGNRVKYAP